MSVLAQTDVSTTDTSVVFAANRPFSCADERNIEVEVLLQAFTALRRDGILSDAEYEAKRRRLAEQH